MDQPGNNHLMLRGSQSPPPAYNGQHAAADRMRELLARTVHDHLVEERSVAGALQEIRSRLEAIGEASATGIAATVDGLAATLDGLAATLGALDSKLTARLERLDERLDDQYDRVRSMDGKLECQSASTEETVAKAVEAATAGITARIASLEDTVLTLAEALLRPAVHGTHPSSAPRNGSFQA
jgi:transposase